MYTRLFGQGLAENSEALRPNPSQLCTVHFGLSLNLVNCSLKMKSLQPLLPAKLTIILKLASRQEPEEPERLKRSSRERTSCSQIHSTLHLPSGVRCARTKCTAVCVSSYPLVMFPLFFSVHAASLQRDDSLPSLLPKAHLSSNSWLTM